MKIEFNQYVILSDFNTFRGGDFAILIVNNGFSV